MKFEQAVAVLEDIPYTSPPKGRFFYDFVFEHRPERILELGVAHGVSACYFAAALQEYGGRIDCVDLARNNVEPNVDELTRRLGLTNVTPHYETSSYTWFLRNEIERNTVNGVCQPVYDLIFIDGPKDWTNDGAAFFMADKLLREGGWMIFDDYSWTYRDFNESKGKVFPEMSEEELTTPQIKTVIDLLVMQHPSYGEFEIRDDILALAHKVKSDTKTVRRTTQWSAGYVLRKLMHKLLRH